MNEESETVSDPAVKAQKTTRVVTSEESGSNAEQRGHAQVLCARRGERHMVVSHLLALLAAQWSNDGEQIANTSHQMAKMDGCSRGLECFNLMPPPDILADITCVFQHVSEHFQLKNWNCDRL